MRPDVRIETEEPDPRAEIGLLDLLGEFALEPFVAGEHRAQQARPGVHTMPHQLGQRGDEDLRALAGREPADEEQLR